MGFFTELFVRPRPKHDARLRGDMDLLGGMSPRDQADVGIKPADFPRIPRRMVERRADA